MSEVSPIYGAAAAAAVTMLLLTAALLAIRKMRAQIKARRAVEHRLQVSESRLRAAMEGTETGLWEWNPQTSDVYLDPVWFTMLGYTPDALPKAFKTFEKLVHPEDREIVHATIAEVVSKRLDRFSMDFRLRSQDGNYRWIRSRGRLLETDSAGNPVRLIGIHSDVTHQKEMQEALREGERKLLKAQETAHIGHWEWDIPNDEISWSDEIYRIYGIDRETPLTYERLMQAIHPEDRQYHDEHTTGWLKNRSGSPFDYRVIRPDGDIRYVYARGEVEVDESGEPVRFTGIVQDITDTKLRELRLQEYQQRLKSLAGQLTLAEERERRRIAADLHDHVGQSLALTRLQLAAARKGLPAEGQLTAQLEEISQSLLHIIQDTRQLIFELSSPALDDLGLGAAVADWSEQRANNQQGLHIEVVDHARQVALDADQRAILFRNIRELITNASKHAQASVLSIRLEQANDELVVTVQDDGVGFDPTTAPREIKSRGFGLFSIEERMTDLGGKLELVSRPGEGCRAILRLPLRVRDLESLP